MKPRYDYPEIRMWIFYADLDVFILQFGNERPTLLIELPNNDFYVSRSKDDAISFATSRGYPRIRPFTIHKVRTSKATNTVEFTCDLLRDW